MKKKTTVDKCRKKNLKAVDKFTEVLAYLIFELAVLNKRFDSQIFAWGYEFML